MNDAALFLFSGDPARLGDGAAPDAALERFASILLGADPFQPFAEGRADALIAERLAADRLRRGRELFPNELARAHPFRILYGLAKDRAAKAKPISADAAAMTTAGRTLAALCRLRHRQRAALSLRYVLGMSEVEVAFVLGAPPRVAASVIRSAASALSRGAGRPIDVPRALRALGRALSASAPSAAEAEHARVADPARLPRAVFRRLLAPPPPGVAEPGARSEPLARAPRPVYALLAPPAAKRSHGSRHESAPRRRNRALLERALTFAAVIAMLALASVAPGWSRSGVTAAPVAVVPLGPRIVEAAAPAAPIPTFGASTYRVRPGDTLWTIAAYTLGEAYRWREIWRANAGRRMDGGELFLDPDRIRPGWTLRLPAGGG